MVDFFEESELTNHFQIRKDLLPTKGDCLLYVISRTIKVKGGTNFMKHSRAVFQLAGIVEEIWNDADCCPFARGHIVKIFDEKIWQPYLHLRREKCLPTQSSGRKRSHKKDPTKKKIRFH